MDNINKSVESIAIKSAHDVSENADSSSQLVEEHSSAGPFVDIIESSENVDCEKINTQVEDTDANLQNMFSVVKKNIPKEITGMYNTNESNKVEQITEHGKNYNPEIMEIEDGTPRKCVKAKTSNVPPSSIKNVIKKPTSIEITEKEQNVYSKAIEIVESENKNENQSNVDVDQSIEFSHDSPIIQDLNLEKPSEFTHVDVDRSEVASEDSEELARSAKNALAETEDLDIEMENVEVVKSIDVTKQNETSLDPNCRMELDEQDCNIQSEKSLTIAEEADVSDKESTEKTQEPENTEFVQISQDKQDDSQIEGQSIDAEDPFGGDNLCSETAEQMETEVIEQRENFKKLGEQADNLQDLVNAKGSANSSESRGKDVGITSAENSEQSSKSSTNVTSADKTDKDGNQNSKNSDKNSEVLPGQDDELCIIPDSMKIILPKKDEKIAGDKSDKDSVSDSVTQNAKSPENGEVSELTKKSSVVQEVVSDVESNAKTTEKETVENSQSSPKVVPMATDVIDVDEESKGSDEVEEIKNNETCKQCNANKLCRFKVKSGTEVYNVCSKSCRSAYQEANNKAMDIPSDGVNSKKEKRCASCLLIVEPNDERNLSWETMEFCNEECLGKFQTKYGSYCRNCNGPVQAVSLGKYCVRFGYDVRQFCCSTCLEEFKKGLKVCSYCQKDISAGTEGFLAPVGDKGQFKDFCTQECMEKFSRMSSAEPYIGEKKACGVCQEVKIVYCEVQIDRATPVPICSEPCFAAFKFVNKVDPEQCSTCKKYFENPNKKGFVVFYEKEAHSFCSKTCLNVFIITNRKIVPCNWCKVKKYNFDMIKKELKIGQVIMMCSLNCLTLYQVSINAVSAKRIRCDYCKEFSQAQYHLTMSDATIRNFCSYNCVMNFQGQYTKSPITIPSSDDPVPTGLPKRTIPPTQRTLASSSLKTAEMQTKKTLPVISSVTSLASMNGQQIENATTPQTNKTTVNVPQLTVTGQPQIIYKQQIVTRPPSPTKIHNKSTQCKPLTHTKGVSVRPRQVTKSTQTEKELKPVVPIPVPIYVPYPMHMFSFPFPVPVPIPLPVPVPIFIPTTRNSAKGIFKEIKKIQEKMPADPFEAELLMMAEMVATEKKNESDSDSADENRDDAYDQSNAHSDSCSPEGVDSSNTFGEDMLQMALKMATGEIEEPAVDLEAALTPNTITASQAPAQSDTTIESDAQPERLIGSTRGRKRMAQYKPRANKRSRRVSAANDVPLMPPPESQPSSQQRFMEPAEKPDANMALKYTFGVNAWREWVVAKNAELEKQSTPARKFKLFKTDLLQLTADELNYSLCLFVKEVRKPNGTEYAPDTIYYLCLGIQQYLFENNRIDNIFTDSYYEKFTDCLNEVAKKFSMIYNDSQYIVTRVEEEHLWECKQLGAHSPHVLLSTLMFFNTKHFNLVTVEEHMQLSFSHIMKHWKRNPAAQPSAVAGKLPGSRNVLLRFYPPQSALEANSRKKKVYEQQENEENPMRCPVKLYEFYLSKCPESVKTRNDIFYLLPERSCVPDSPVWYSTSPLAKEHLVKMLYRIKMVKEINVALLSS